MNELHTKIMKVVDEYESTDKSELIKDLLIKLGDDECADILFRLENHMPMFGD